MLINIEILSIAANNMGKYVQYDVAYKDLKDGKVNGKKVADFSIKEGKSILQNAKQGDKLAVTLVKNDKYWNWEKVEKSDGAATSSPAAGQATPRSTYETPEERARKQDYIIRQSSLSSAIAVLKTEKNTPSKDEVVALAEEFVKFVYAKPTPEQAIANMPDDIPY